MFHFMKTFEKVKKEKFVVSVDNPFCGGAKTIAGTFGGDIWTIQVELNYDITNNIKIRTD